MLKRAGSAPLPTGDECNTEDLKKLLESIAIDEGQGKYRDAIKRCDEFKERKNWSTLDHCTKVIVLLRKACLYTITGKFSLTLRTIDEAAQQLDEDEHLELRALLFCEKGRALNSLGNHDEAIEQYRKGQAYSKDLDDKLGIARADEGLGKAFLAKGKVERTTEFLERSLTVAKERESIPLQMRANTGLGYFCLKTGEYDQAVIYANDAKEGSGPHRDSLAHLDVYKLEGDVELERGMNDNAIKIYKEILSLAEKHKVELAQTQANASLGRAHLKNEKFDLAKQYFDAFIEILTRVLGSLDDADLRCHLPGLIEKYATYVDWAVFAAACHEGDMNKALRIDEEFRFYALLEDIADHTVFRKRRENKPIIKSIAQSVDAALLVKYKYFNGVLMTWVISAESGELEYSTTMHDEYEIPRLVYRATFKEWTLWTDKLRIISESIQNKEKNNEEVSDDWIQGQIEEHIPDSMKNDMDENTWVSIRQPKVLREVAANKSCRAVRDVQCHTFKNGGSAMEKISELLWNPVVGNCQRVKETLNREGECSKLVSVCFFSFRN